MFLLLVYSFVRREPLMELHSLCFMYCCLFFTAILMTLTTPVFLVILII